MNKIVDFDKIGYVAATFPVADETISKLKETYTNPQTGNVDVNGKNLAVTLGNDNKVKFGTGEEALLGIIMAYEMDGFASVQITGGVSEVPTKAELKSGIKKLGVDADGKIVEVEAGRPTTVAIGATTEGKLATIIL